MSNRIEKAKRRKVKARKEVGNLSREGREGGTEVRKETSKPTAPPVYACKSAAVLPVVAKDPANPRLNRTLANHPEIDLAVGDSVAKIRQRW